MLFSCCEAFTNKALLLLIFSLHMSNIKGRSPVFFPQVHINTVCSQETFEFDFV